MNTEGDLTPAPEPDPVGVPPVAPVVAPAAHRSWFARHRRLLIPAAGVLALGAVSAAAVLLLAKPNATVEKMVPATADVIAVANLDPSVAQKVNLMRAVHSFPDYKTDKAINDKLDAAFKDSGFSFTTDIQPWLGPEIGFSAQLNLTNANTSPAAFYAVSRDDTKARATLAKLRASKWGKKFQWKDETYNGFTISVGTPTVTTEKANAYSYIDHVVVIATSSAMIHEIIDTEQGRTPRLVDSSDYKATLAGLPSDRVGFVYVNGKSLVANFKKEMATTPALSLALRNMNDVEALQGIGATLSANGDGLLADLLVKLDASKLAPATREALAHAGSTDVVLRWIPKGSAAFLAIANLNRTIQTVLDQAGTDPSVTAGTNAIGLTGPGGVLPHLTGDAGLEVEFGSNGLPAGGILLGTDNARSMSAFFGKLLTLAEGAASSGFSGSSGSGSGSSAGPGLGASSAAGRITTSTYRGVVITSWTSPELSQLGAFSPSYALLDGMGILASTPDEVKAIIDGHKGGATIASDPTYKTASAASLAKPSAIVYVDIAKLLDAIRQSPFGSQAGLGFNATTDANLAPLRAFVLTATSQADKAVERFFVMIR
ncbi:MAG TPA: DUF3352 domain-containing protein [Candidatus Dormibacteraeota bacterium]|nr:DUF3352 domain-containing protein [Candidatus Dormibacteraeota bacterium]